MFKKYPKVADEMSIEYEAIADKAEVELKKEVNDLCKKYGEKPKYRTDYKNKK